MQCEDRRQPLKKRLISTVSGTQAREQRLAPGKFSAGSLVSIAFMATSGVQAQKPTSLFIWWASLVKGDAFGCSGYSACVQSC